MLHEARRHDSTAYLFPEGVMNQLVYERIQAGRAKDAIELGKLWVEASPASAKAYDSLGDGYLADGQKEPALQALGILSSLVPDTIAHYRLMSKLGKEGWAEAFHCKDVSAARLSRASASAGPAKRLRLRSRRSTRPLQPGGKLKFQLNETRQVPVSSRESTIVS